MRKRKTVKEMKTKVKTKKDESEDKERRNEEIKDER
jgi:hypothetical protein